MTSDLRKFSPSSARNKEPLLEVIKRVFPRKGLVLEIASGAGEHASFIAPALGHIDWQPSEFDAGLLDSINAHASFDGAKSVRPAIQLDVTRYPWPVENVSAILNCNMIHISPWLVTEGLMKGAGLVLKSGGIMVMYGPYKRAGKHTAPSNAAFDENLRGRDASWGIRDLEDVVALAEVNGLIPQDIIEMPANNLSIVYSKI